MQTDSATLRKLLSQDLMDVIIRGSLIAFVVVMCVRIFAPFAGLMIWALILAVALYPLHRQLAKRLGDRQGRAAALLVAAVLLLIGIPTVMLGSSLVGQIHSGYTAFDIKAISIRQPDPSVADWPIVGGTIYKAWSSAATDLPAFLEKILPQLRSAANQLLSVVAHGAGGIFVFLGSLIIAGVMMAYGESGSQAMLRILKRFSGPDKGPRLHALSTATVRSVAMGVIGVAFIQALLLGVGFLLAGIPAPGVLALLVLLVGIAQLPLVLVSLPAIAYLWWSGDTSTTMNIVFTVYFVAAGFVDSVLKPMLLGRGVEAPMPVILLGALGGMISSGIVGLFVGAVVLAVGYQLFMAWIDAAAGEDAPAGAVDTQGPAEAPATNK